MALPRRAIPCECSANAFSGAGLDRSTSMPDCCGGSALRPNAECISLAKRGDEIIARVDCTAGAPEVAGSHLSPHGQLAANQIGGEFRQSGRFAIRRPDFDPHVTALDVTGFVERLTEWGGPTSAEKIKLEIADRWDCRPQAVLWTAYRGRGCTSGLSGLGLPIFFAVREAGSGPSRLLLRRSNRR
jgi:hypothetical protein